MIYQYTFIHIYLVFYNVREREITFEKKNTYYIYSNIVYLYYITMLTAEHDSFSVERNIGLSVRI